MLEADLDEWRWCCPLSRSEHTHSPVSGLIHVHLWPWANCAIPTNNDYIYSRLNYCHLYKSETKETSHKQAAQQHQKESNSKVFLDMVNVSLSPRRAPLCGIQSVILRAGNCLVGTWLHGKPLHWSKRGCSWRCDWGDFSIKRDVCGGAWCTRPTIHELPPALHLQAPTIHQVVDMH